MPRFVLIDHSLKGVGGHHYEYALHVCRAAEAAGFQPVLATHRRFSDRGLMNGAWQMLTPYRASTYSEHAILGNLAKWHARRPATVGGRARPRLIDWLARCQDRLFAWRRQWQSNLRSTAFERGTRALMQQLHLTPGDQLFIPTLNELDLIGLLRYLRSDVASRRVAWHLQFHYDIDPDGEETAADSNYRSRLREIFSECQELLATHRLFFYTTTRQLAAQYNRLNVVKFHGLPYPVNPEIQCSDPSPPAKSPLVTTCLGGVRDEKGLPFLSGMLDELWPEYFSTGRMQLVLQAERAGKLPAAVRRRVGPSSAQPTIGSPVQVVPHPLNSEAYLRLLKDSDIGLLMYDRRQYLNRCSGVLVEMLTAGVPVIVPAGCWLAEQVAEEISRHQEGLRAKLPVVQTIVDAGSELDAPPRATHALITFRWSADATTSWARLRVRQFNAQGGAMQADDVTVGQRVEGRPATALVPLVAGARRVQLEWRAAYRDAAITIRHVQLDFLSAAQEPGHSCPLGAVGLIATEPDQVPTLLRNLVDHYPHYRRTAAEFARRWIQWHNPDRVVAELLAAANTSVGDRPRVGPPAPHFATGWLPVESVTGR